MFNIKMYLLSVLCLAVAVTALPTIPPPPSLPEPRIVAVPGSVLRTNVPEVASEDSKDDDDDDKKIILLSAIPAPPELPPLDESILVVKKPESDEKSSESEEKKSEPEEKKPEKLKEEHSEETKDVSKDQDWTEPKKEDSKEETTWEVKKDSTKLDLSSLTDIFSTLLGILDPFGLLSFLIPADEAEEAYKSPALSNYIIVKEY